MKQINKILHTPVTLTQSWVIYSVWKKTQIGITIYHDEISNKKFKNNLNFIKKLQCQLKFSDNLTYTLRQYTI